MSKHPHFHALLAALAASVVLAGTGLAVAASQRHDRSALYHRRSEDRKLVQRKLEQRHTRAVLDVTYPSEGVNVTPANADASAAASSDGMATATQVMSALASYPGAIGAFGPSVSNAQMSASLETVTEQYPMTDKVAAGVPFEAWVVRTSGPPTYVGGVGTTPPTTAQTCDDVAIYDLALAGWTDFIQSC
jgi:hypothetical protein